MTSEDRVTQFKFTDYAPLAFAKLRERFAIAEDDYTESLGPEQVLKSFLSNDFTTLQERYSSGQSGSIFYYTKNKKFMMKTIPRREFRNFRAVLKDYFFHLKDNMESLLCRFFGLHRIQYIDQGGSKRTLFLVVMDNAFKDFQISEFFDLKGSTQGRNLLKPGQDISMRKTRLGKTAALKDLDFLRYFKDSIVLDETNE